jgi:mannose-1-phosphate guanylyltransferase
MSEPNALVLAGGSGTRFWPLSRRRRPKQLLALVDDRSLLRATVERLAPLVPPERVFISVTAELAGAVAAEVPEVSGERLIVEPAGRNTAPAILWAVLQMPEAERTRPLIVTPSDHWIREPLSFRSSLAVAVEECHGRILTLGVVPHRAETGFGYLELEEPVSGVTRPLRLRAFVEKPSRERAQVFCASGRHLWNAGLFVFEPRYLLECCRRIQPALLEQLERAAAEREPAARRHHFEQAQAVSIDSALMERLDELWTVPLECGWSDLGSWEALAELLPENANATRGDVIAIDARDNVLVADDGSVVALGVEGLVIVRTSDTVLVLPRSRAQDVRQVVEALRENDRDELL